MTTHRELQEILKELCLYANNINLNIESNKYTQKFTFVVHDVHSPDSHVGIEMGVLLGLGVKTVLFICFETNEEKETFTFTNTAVLKEAIHDLNLCDELQEAIDQSVLQLERFL